MRAVNLSNCKEIFNEFYAHKIEVLGVAIRVTTPIKGWKYERKIVKHIYIKSHGKRFDLCETSEFGKNTRIKITANPFNPKLPTNKNSNAYHHVVNYYIAKEPIVHFKEIKSKVIEKISCELFEIFLKDSIDTGIELTSNGNLIEVGESVFKKNVLEKSDIKK